MCVCVCVCFYMCSVFVCVALQGRRLCICVCVVVVYSKYFYRSDHLGFMSESPAVSTTPAPGRERERERETNLCLSFLVVWYGSVQSQQSLMECKYIYSSTVLKNRFEVLVLYLSIFIFHLNLKLIFEHLHFIFSDFYLRILNFTYFAHFQITIS